MNTVEEIEKAIERLAPPDFARLASWIGQRQMASWKGQMDEDAAAGRLDFLFEETERERKTGALRDWPDPK